MLTDNVLKYKIKYSSSFIFVCLKNMSSGTKPILCHHIVYTMNIIKIILKTYLSLIFFYSYC